VFFDHEVRRLAAMLGLAPAASSRDVPRATAAEIDES
jgi:hypothetical protein